MFAGWTAEDNPLSANHCADDIYATTTIERPRRACDDVIGAHMTSVCLESGAYRWGVNALIMLVVGNAARDL